MTSAIRRALLIAGFVMALVVVVVPDPCAWVPWFMRALVGCTCTQGGGGSAAGGGCSGAASNGAPAKYIGGGRGGIQLVARR